MPFAKKQNLYSDRKRSRQQLSKLLLLLFLSLASCRSYYNSLTEVDSIRVSEAVSLENTETDAMIAPFRSRMELEMNEEIGILEMKLTKSQPESTLGNWLADMLYEEVKLINNNQLDFAIQNQGGVRINELSAGPITVGEIFEIMPFDNLTTIMWSKGDVIQALCDHIAADGGWPVSSGLRFSISNKKAIDVHISGEQLDPDKTYVFALPDYIANGGSGTDFLQNEKREDRELLIRDAFLRNIRKKTTTGLKQFAQLDGRIILIDNE